MRFWVFHREHTDFPCHPFSWAGLQRLVTGPVPASPAWHVGPPRAGWQRPGPCAGQKAAVARGFGPQCLEPVLLLRAASAQREAGRRCDFTPTLAGLRAWRGEGAGDAVRTKAGRRSGQRAATHGVRGGSPPGRASAARGRGAAACVRHLPRGGRSLRVPTGKREGPPSTVSPSGGRVLGLGAPVRPRPAACSILGLSLPAGRTTAQLGASTQGPLCWPHSVSVWPRPPRSVSLSPDSR